MTDVQTTAKTMVDDSDRGPAPVEGAEVHRGFVREMHNRLGKAYGTGGGVVVAVFFCVVALAAIMGWWTQLTLWIPGLTLVLGALFVVRHRIYRKRDRMRERVEKYCQANGVGVDTLLEYYDTEEMYPFFGTIFEEPVSRQHRQQGADDQAR